MVRDRTQKGFTLMELLFTIAVAAVVLSFGVPGFLSFVANNRAVTHTNDLVTALNLGRSEATRRGSAVRLCSSADGVGCSGNKDWSTGWILVTTGDDVLRSWPERSGGAGVVTEKADITEIRFQARGSVAGSPEFEVRLPNCSGNQVRKVAVNGTGRVSVAREDCS